MGLRLLKRGVYAEGIIRVLEYPSDPIESIKKATGLSGADLSKLVDKIKFDLRIRKAKKSFGRRLEIPKKRLLEFLLNELKQTTVSIPIKIKNRLCLITFASDISCLDKQQSEPQSIKGIMVDIKIPKEASNSWGTSRYRFLRITDESERAIGHAFQDFNIYIFKNNLYYFDDSDMHTQEEHLLLIKEHYFKQERKFKRLQKDIRLFEKLEAKEIEPREPIPEDVRFAVWRRDGGRCVTCGSKKNLEFDHIIPKSKGGGDSARNIQLLCQRCNREKSDKI
jgi:hypothetical protein